MIHAAKMSELGEMAGGIAHEINNPLAIIMGKSAQVVGMLKKGKYDRDTLIDSMSLISRTSERIAQIIKGLRAFSRNAEHDPFARTLLRTVIDDTLALCLERIKSCGLSLSVLCPDDLAIDCRPSQISQVIMNLVSNAVDAVGDQSNAWIRVIGETMAGEVVVSVVDSGRGVTSEVAARMMDPFFTTKDVGKGTGLGLSISSAIVAAHHGKLEYDSGSPNTRFVLRFPVAVDSQGSVKAA